MNVYDDGTPPPDSTQENGPVKRENKPNQPNISHVQNINTLQNIQNIPPMAHTNLTGDSEIVDMQNYQINLDDQMNQHLTSHSAEIGRWSLIGDAANVQYAILTDNLGPHPQMQPLRVNNINPENVAVTFNQAYVKYILQQHNDIQNDGSQYNFGPNIIFSFPANTHEEMPHMMNNMMAIPQQPPGSIEFMTQNQPWIGHMSSMPTLDPRNIYQVRQADRSERVIRMAMMEPGDQKFNKPVFSYSCLIALALKNSQTGSLPVNEIYKYMQDNFPYFKNAPDGWKNSVRHNLSLNKAFQKNVRNDLSSTQRKGCLWTLKPDKRRSIDKEIKKWFKKHPDAIRKSMTNPDNFHQYFNPELADSGEENSGSPIRDDTISERQNNFAPQTIQPMEGTTQSLDQISFFQNGMSQSPIEPITQQSDQFEANLNTFFGDFTPASWTTFSFQSNSKNEENTDETDNNQPFNLFRNH